MNTPLIGLIISTEMCPRQRLELQHGLMSQIPPVREKHRTPTRLKQTIRQNHLILPTVPIRTNGCSSNSITILATLEQIIDQINGHKGIHGGSFWQRAGRVYQR